MSVSSLHDDFAIKSYATIIESMMSLGKTKVKMKFLNNEYLTHGLFKAKIWNLPGLPFFPETVSFFFDFTSFFRPFLLLFSFTSQTHSAGTS